MLLLCALLVVAQSESAPVWPDALLRADEALARGDSESAIATLDEVEVQRPGLATTLYYRARALAAEQPELALEALEKLRERGGYDPAIARWDPLLADVREDERFEQALSDVGARRRDRRRLAIGASYAGTARCESIDPYDEGGPPQQVVWSDGRERDSGRPLRRARSWGASPPASSRHGTTLPRAVGLSGSEATFVFDAEGERALSLEPGGVVAVHQLRGAEPARRASEFFALEGPKSQGPWASNAAAWREPFAAFACEHGAIDRRPRP